MQNLKSLYQKLYKCCNTEARLSQKLNSLNSLFNGNHKIVDEALEQKIKASSFLLLEGFGEAICLHCAIILYLRSTLSLSLSLSLSKSKQFFMFNYCLRICLFVSFIFLIILTKVHISLYLCEFPFCFDSLIWNADAFMSIQEFCNFNNLIFIPFYHNCLMFMCISTSYKLIYYKSWVLKLVDAYTNNTFSFLKACNNDTCHFFFFCFLLEMN